MLKLEDIAPGMTDRAAFVGQTGSGKTTLAQEVCRLRPWVVALDPKGMLEWDGYEVHERLSALTKAKRPRLIYRPVYEELADEETIDTFFEFVYERRNCVLYVDEIYAVAQGDSYPWFFGACLTRGRERGISTYVATQRPSRVPQVMLSESEHVFVFNLKLPQDRERIADITGMDDGQFRLPAHEFYYIPQVGDPRGPLKLQLKGKGQAHVEDRDGRADLPARRLSGQAVD